MFNQEKFDEVYYICKCGGVPMYPTEHSIFKKRIIGQSDEYIKNRGKFVVDFLNKHGFDMTIDDE